MALGSVISSDACGSHMSCRTIYLQKNKKIYWIRKHPPVTERKKDADNEKMVFVEGGGRG